MKEIKHLIFDEKSGFYNRVCFRHLNKKAKIEVLLEENEMLIRENASLRDLLCEAKKQIKWKDRIVKESEEIEILYPDEK